MLSRISQTNLGSNFFNLLALVNSTKHFKKNPGCLVSFSELSSDQEYKLMLTSTHTGIID